MNNKHKKTKNAFTLVELVIVIAVIAILAAVLIPTFANVIKNAKESARIQQLKAIQKEYISACQLVPLEETIGTIIIIDDDYYIINEKLEIEKIDNVEDYNIEEKYVQVPNLSIPDNTKVLKPTEQSSYKIEFVVKNGTPINDLYFTAGKGLNNLPIAEKLGYNFIGWTKTENDEDVEYITSIDNKTSSNVILYAKFNARTDITYKISYYFENINDNNYTLNETLSKTYNNGITDKELTIDTSDMEGFNLDESDIKTKKIEADGSTEFEIHYKRKLYTINWYREDGTLIESEQYKYEDIPKYPESSNPEKSETEKNIYIFKGWSTQIDGKTETFTKITANKNYYPIFKESGKTFSLIIKNCNDSVIETKEYQYGKGIKLERSANILGWTKTVNIDDIDYVSEISSEEYGDKVLYQKSIASDVVFGSYQGEALEWKVLDIIDGNALLINKKMVYPFYNSINETIEWANDEFFNNAFSDYEKSLIQSKKFIDEYNNEYSGKLLVVNENEFNKYFDCRSIMMNSSGFSNYAINAFQNHYYSGGRTMKQIKDDIDTLGNVYTPIISNNSVTCYFDGFNIINRDSDYPFVDPSYTNNDETGKVVYSQLSCYGGVLLTMLVKINLNSTLTYHLDPSTKINVLNNEGLYDEIVGNNDGTTTYQINMNINTEGIQLIKPDNKDNTFTSNVYYYFDNWYMDKNLTMKIDISSSIYSPFFNIDVYPKWQISISEINYSWNLLETDGEISTLVGISNETIPYYINGDECMISIDNGGYYNKECSSVEFNGNPYNTFYNSINSLGNDEYRNKLINSIQSVEILDATTFDEYNIKTNFVNYRDINCWISGYGNSINYINEYGYIESENLPENDYGINYEEQPIKNVATIMKINLNNLI